MNDNLTPVYLKVPEGYVGFVEELPGANTQGKRWKKFKPTYTKRSGSYWKPIGS
ncbi:hypothetical protein [Spirosoma koreense]